MTGRLDPVDGDERRQQPVAPGLNQRDERRTLGGPQFERDGHADGAGEVLGARAPVSLLRPAVLLREDVGRPADRQRPGPLRAFRLVGAERDQVGAERVHVEVDPRRGLDALP